MVIECPNCGWVRDMGQSECDKTKARCPECEEIFTIDHSKEKNKVAKNKPSKNQTPNNTNVYILRIVTGGYFLCGSLILLIAGLNYFSSRSTQSLGVERHHIVQ